MMINKENNDKTLLPPTKSEKGFVETAYIGVQSHIIIKDKETGKILVNKRG